MLVPLEPERSQASADVRVGGGQGGGEKAEQMIKVAGAIVRLLHPPPLAHLNLLNYTSSAGKPSLQKGSQEKAFAVNALIRLSEKS